MVEEYITTLVGGRDKYTVLVRFTFIYFCCRDTITEDSIAWYGITLHMTDILFFFCLKYGWSGV